MDSVHPRSTTSPTADPDLASDRADELGAHARHNVVASLPKARLDNGVVDSDSRSSDLEEEAAVDADLFNGAHRDAKLELLEEFADAVAVDQINRGRSVS